jgi:DNA-binding transcriptional LysR family regulator
MKRLAKLTRHGETFLPHAVRILEEVEAARREAVDVQMLSAATPVSADLRRRLK